MKILSLHCDYIKFKPMQKALKQPEELAEEQKKTKEVKGYVIYNVKKSGETLIDIKIPINILKTISYL